MTLVCVMCGYAPSFPAPCCMLVLWSGQEASNYGLVHRALMPHISLLLSVVVTAPTNTRSNASMSCLPWCGSWTAYGFDILLCHFVVSKMFGTLPIFLLQQEKFDSSQLHKQGVTCTFSMPVLLLYWQLCTIVRPASSAISHLLGRGPMEPKFVLAMLDEFSCLTPEMAGTLPVPLQPKMQCVRQPAGSSQLTCDRRKIPMGLPAR